MSDLRGLTSRTKAMSRRKAVSVPERTHEQKAVSDLRGLTSRRKAISDPERTREQDMNKWTDANGLELRTHADAWRRKR